MCCVLRKVLFVLTGNVVNGTIGKQMVDMLVESSNNVAMILKFFDMFLKLKDLTSSDTFKEYDPDGKGKLYLMGSQRVKVLMLSGSEISPIC